jgi:hypothetical protein
VDAVLALVVFVVLISLVWLAVMRRLNDDGIPVRATLEEDGEIRKWSAERERRQEDHVATDTRLGRAKDRNVAQTWGPGL